MNKKKKSDVHNKESTSKTRNFQTAYLIRFRFWKSHHSKQTDLALLFFKDFLQNMELIIIEEKNEYR